MRRWLVLLALLAGSSALADVTLEGRTLKSENGGRVLWQKEFPAVMGDLTQPLNFEGRSYIGVGPAVYAYAPDGTFVGRADLPALSTSLDSGGGTLGVSTQGDGYTERFTLGDPESNLNIPLQERAVMPPDPAVTGWLARVADAFPEAALPRAVRDFPANPFLALREAERLNHAGDRYAALSEVRRALRGQVPFPAWTALAVRLDRAGFPAAADLALEHAKRDAATRGIDPEVPVSREALLAYGNPSGYIGTLLAQNRLGRAEVWMNFLRELYPRFEGHSALYARYADLLQAQGRVGEAEEWRQFDRSLRGGTLYNLGSDDTSAVRDVARLATLALCVALLAAFLTLAARAWRQQGEDTKSYGGRLRSVWQRPMTRARLGILSYASLSERLTLTMLCVALLAALGGWQWANSTGEGLRAPALNIGTYGGGWYNAHLDDLDLRVTPDTALLSGLAAQLDGDDTAAREAYAGAGQDACALNNLGVIAQNRDDQPQALELYRAALAARPDLSAAAYNLGLDQHTPSTTFQRTYRRSQPRLCYPDRRNMARAVSGDLSVTLRRDLTNPLGFLGQKNQRMGWVMLLALALLLGLVFLLLVPRAASSARLGRPPLYRLLAVLFPGTSLIGNAWGGMLLLAWAATVAALLPLSGVVKFPLLPSPQQPSLRNTLLLGLLLTYGLNLLAFSLIEARVFRRRGELKE
ncbi:hypothetical protein Dxin01_01101 [Deinococcus xinjiangensis]|uniref:Tetratricopeptide repeat protein n=1 Tax=Deinococcus xinjiangensis TaxID=457454 RepID=A0ABP9V7X0_9DEIO